MPPKKARKEAPEKELYMPKLPDRIVEETEAAWILVAYQDFNYHGRPLDREEVDGMIGYKFNLEIFNLSTMYARFDKPDNEFTIRIRSLVEENKQTYMNRVEEIFQRFLDRSEEARDRVANLSPM